LSMHFTRRIGLAIGLSVTIIAFGIIFMETTDKKRLPIDSNPESNRFALMSPALTNNDPIQPVYTCRGQNMRLPLSIHRPPSGTKSLTVIMSDPDAVNGEWTHWLIWNIDPATENIDEKSLPVGAIEGLTSFGKQGYSGPCPSAGTGVHRYVFEIYALDQVLDLPASADRNQFKTAVSGHVIEEARLTGSFEAE
jgi:Raf kinase inhibitor-like YbhB/YbcL family protein